MSGDVTIKVEGARECEQMIKALGNAFAATAMAKALRAPMQDVLASAKAKVPKRTGALYEALQLTPVKRATAKRATMADTLSEVGIRIVKPKWGAARTGGASRSGRKANPRRYWHLVEFGTSRTPARSFLRAAWDEHEPDLAEKSVRWLRKQIEFQQKRFAHMSRRNRG